MLIAIQIALLIMVFFSGVTAISRQTDSDTKNNALIVFVISIAVLVVIIL